MQTSAEKRAGTDAFVYPDAQEIIDNVCEETGLREFGPAKFRDGLERLLDSLRTEVDLTPDSARQQVAVINRRLANRLEVEQWYADHPETAEVEVGPPVSITGLPRTGTSALSAIMSLDEQFRPLRSWEINKPCPPPILGEEDSDPRLQAAVAAGERMAREQPEMMAMHLWDPASTEEDVEILGMNFHAQQFALPLFRYHAWWRETDMDETYAYHKRVIRMLQSRRPPNRWLFKAPAHSYHLESWVRAYPDAKILMTHRDPGKVIPSAASFVRALQPPGITIDPVRFGQKRAEHLRVGVEKAMAARSRLGDDRFFDVQHTDLVSDPFGTIERIYDFLDLDLTPTTLATMEAWHRKNRSGAHGSHSYTAQEFGLDQDQLRRDFADYIDRYDIKIG